MNASRIVRLLLLVALIAGLFTLPRTSWGQAHLPRDFDSLAQEVRSLAPYDQVAYVVIYILGTAVLLPGTLLSFVGATLFGTWRGTVLTWIGAVIGSSVIFGVTRWLGRDAFKSLVDRILAGRFDVFDRWVTEHGFRALLLARLVPLFPFNGVNLAAGLTGIGWRSYVLATAIGILPGTFVYQYLFANVGQRILSRGVQLNDLTDPNILVPIGVFVVFLFVGRWVARRKRPGGLSS